MSSCINVLTQRTVSTWKKKDEDQKEMLRDSRYNGGDKPGLYYRNSNSRHHLYYTGQSAYGLDFSCCYSYMEPRSDRGPYVLYSRS